MQYVGIIAQQEHHIFDLPRSGAMEVPFISQMRLAPAAKAPKAYGKLDGLRFSEKTGLNHRFRAPKLLA